MIFNKIPISKSTFEDATEMQCCIGGNWESPIGPNINSILAKEGLNFIGLQGSSEVGLIDDV